MVGVIVAVEEEVGENIAVKEVVALVDLGKWVAETRGEVVTVAANPREQ